MILALEPLHELLEAVRNLNNGLHLYATADHTIRVLRLLVKRRLLKCLAESYTRLEKLVDDGACTLTHGNWTKPGISTTAYVILLF
jgi:hypothetical protein